MRDLKHIHFFEQLLEQADNKLVRQEREAGGVAVGYTCYYLPEALLNCGKAFSVRLRAPNTGSLDISHYYMSSFICGYTRALREEYGLPTLGIDREYVVRGSGQLATRIQAFKEEP